MNNIKLFKEKGYCIVKSAISNELRDFVTQYSLFDELQDFTPDGEQVPNAHSKYADPAMETVLLHIHNTMQENTGLKLWPTYSFYRVYRPGDVLESHIDRPSCEISATLCFGYDYQGTDYKWPIFMNGTPVELEPGDMVIYRGCDLEHWRDELVVPDGSWHVQGFFHYVDNDGPFKIFKYDQRSTIGEKNINHKVSTRNITSTKSYIEYTN